MNTGADRVKGHSRLRDVYGNCRTAPTFWRAALAPCAATVRWGGPLAQAGHQSVLHQRDQGPLGVGAVPGVGGDDRSVGADLQGLAHLLGLVRLVPLEAVERDD